MVNSSERRQLESSYRSEASVRSVLATSAVGLLVVLCVSLAGAVTSYDPSMLTAVSAQSAATDR